MTPLVLPQINSNGTARKVLIEQQLDVIRAYDALIKAMSEAMPHGRVYQLRPAELKPARVAWIERLTAHNDMCATRSSRTRWTIHDGHA